MATQLTDLSVEFVSLVDRAAVRDPSNPSEPQKFLLFKSESGTDTPIPTNNEGGLMADIDDVREAQAKAEQERDEALEAVQKLEQRVAELDKTDNEHAVEEIDKSELPEPVRKALEKAEADAKAADERIAKAEKAAQDAAEVAKAERDQRVTREFVSKAQEQFPHVGGDAETFGPLLKAASEKLTADEYEQLEKRLTASNEQLRTSALFKEYGRGGEPEPSNAHNEATQKAEELQKSGVSKFKAMQQLANQNPELLAR